MNFHRAALITVATTCFATAGLFACSSATNDGTAAGGDGGGNGDGQTSNVDGGGPGVDGGGGDGGGGDGSVSTGAGSATIFVSQLVTSSSTQVGVSAQFYPSAPTPAGCTIGMVAGCTVTSCPPGNGVLRSSLNAGTITVTGTGASSPASLTFGPLGDAGVDGYSSVRAQTRFYNGGDVISFSGAGGPDLPAFTTQTVVAPNDIVLTAPACADVKCPDFSRSADATLTWTGGGAGQVSITYITTTDTTYKTVSCNFDAQASTGTVPTAALMMLDVGTDPGYSGVEVIGPIDSKTIMVGTLPTMLFVQGSGTEGFFTTTD
ncbi:MAG: hypothetical protein JWO86_7303 [Myxococcaceae bacterium]|nr:hypothetical protein [Myxococcaceae bacterium]MEA2745891.1 hypothetical protein [Myxococcales bacterium]